MVIDMATVGSERRWGVRGAGEEGEREVEGGIRVVRD